MGEKKTFQVTVGCMENELFTVEDLRIALVSPFYFLCGKVDVSVAEVVLEQEYD